MDFKWLILIAFVLVVPMPAQAVLPPDIIISVGTQVGQFFSIVSLVLVGVVGSVTFFIRTKFAFMQTYAKYVWLVLAFVLGVTLSSLHNNYLNSSEVDYAAYLKSLNDKISQTASSTEKYYPAIDIAPVEVSTSTITENNYGSSKQFYSDAIYFYGEVDGQVLYLDLDMNRRQEADGTYSHYYYLTGMVNGTDISAYQAVQSSSSVLTTGQFLTEINKYKFSDLSTREGYKGEVLVEGEGLSFVVSGLTGDFITKNTLDYTRYQSVGTAMVTFDGQEFMVQALAEGIYSADYTESIFFPSRGEVVADTYQFALWDTQNNFYLMDSSRVYSNSPKYPSHTWLLTKNSVTGLAKKSFTTNLTAQVSSTGIEDSWFIEMPDFNQAVVSLSLHRYLNGNFEQARSRALVKGVVTDSEGTRDVSGFVQIMK